LSYINTIIGIFFTGEWGRKMHEDLLDAVDFAVKHKIAKKDQIAIMGGSYGGNFFNKLLYLYEYI
jgi:dipeptidyl aminopeptidase/acylaminoacyl peptidase